MILLKTIDSFLGGRREGILLVIEKNEDQGNPSKKVH